jgi:hypothetical protein
MSAASASQPEDLPGHCPCCGGKVHDPNDLIQFQIYVAGPDMPKEVLYGGICDICGESRPKHKKPLVARIVYTRATTGEFMRQDYRCKECFDKFKRKHRMQ